MRIRVISTVFTMLALAVFKPFGLDVWEWMGYVHLLVIGLLGILSCSITEVIMKYVVRKPRSLEKGVDYIIRRNLWFQLINTPIVALNICLYRHLAMSDLVPGNVLSWSNFLETLVIIAFCSFAIGLYWRFKFRSRRDAPVERATARTATGVREARPGCSRSCHQFNDAVAATSRRSRDDSPAEHYPHRVD